MRRPMPDVLFTSAVLLIIALSGVGCPGPAAPVFAPARPPVASLSAVNWGSACVSGDFVREGSGFTTPTDVYVRNMMGRSYRLTGVEIRVDGGTVCRLDGESAVALGGDQVGQMRGVLSPGEHTVSVVLSLRGDGAGVFEYLKAYKIKVRSSRKVVASTQPLCVEIVAFERGEESFEQRPWAAFDVGPCGGSGE